MFHIFPVKVRPAMWAALFFIAVLSACEKPITDLGLGLQPDGDTLNANVLDTFRLQSFTVLEDSVETQNRIISPLGAYLDPVFGRTEAEIFIKLILGGSSLDFTPANGTLEQLVPDSLVLILPYTATDSAYGRLNAPFYMQVNRLSQTFDSDSVYYGNSVFPDDGINLVRAGEEWLMPTPGDSAVVDTVQVAPQMRIPLTLNLAEELISLSGTDTYASSSNFAEYFRGLRIRVDANQMDLFNAGIVRFTFPSGGAGGVRIYYRDTVNDTRLTYLYPFDIAPRFNRFVHDYNFAAPELQSQLNGNTSSGTEHLYLQGLQGTRARITLPDLRYLRDDFRYAINRCQLVVPVDPDLQGGFGPSLRLNVLAINEEGATFPIPDSSTETFFDGNYNRETGEYRINITNYMNDLITGTANDYDIYLQVVGSSINPERTVIRGSDFEDVEGARGLRLEVYYTQY